MSTDVAEMVLGVEIEGAIHGGRHHVRRSVRQAISSVAGWELSYDEVAFEFVPRDIPAVGIKIRGVEGFPQKDLQRLAESVGQAVRRLTPALLVCCQVMSGLQIVASWCTEDE